MLVSWKKDLLLSCILYYFFKVFCTSIACTAQRLVLFTEREIGLALPTFTDWFLIDERVM